PQAAGWGCMPAAVAPGGTLAISGAFGSAFDAPAPGEEGSSGQGWRPGGAGLGRGGSWGHLAGSGAHRSQLIARALGGSAALGRGALGRFRRVRAGSGVPARRALGHGFEESGQRLTRCARGGADANGFESNTSAAPLGPSMQSAQSNLANAPKPGQFGGRLGQ